MFNVPVPPEGPDGLLFPQADDASAAMHAKVNM
jgi:hypothetical protein